MSEGYYGTAIKVPDNQLSVTLSFWRLRHRIWITIVFDEQMNRLLWTFNRGQRWRSCRPHHRYLVRYHSFIFRTYFSELHTAFLAMRCSPEWDCMASVHSVSTPASHIIAGTNLLCLVNRDTRVLVGLLVRKSVGLGIEPGTLRSLSRGFNFTDSIEIFA